MKIVNKKQLTTLILVFIICLVTAIISFGQNCSSYYLNKDSIKGSINTRAGTCLSPDGPNKIIAAPPPNYNYLNNNGYCYVIAPSTKNFDACYTLTAGATTIDFNGGYTTSGCVGINVLSATLYTSGTCILVNPVAIGTVTGLTIGTNYTWCISLRCLGIGPGFNSFCPYYQNIGPLPIELVYFKCIPEDDDIQLNWYTASEVNNDKFELERSINAIDYLKIEELKGQGTSFTPFSYVLRDYFPISGINYYRLKQTDFNGIFTYSNIIACSYNPNNMYQINYYNLLGQAVKFETCIEGMYIKETINNNYIKKEIIYK